MTKKKRKTRQIKAKARLAKKTTMDLSGVWLVHFGGNEIEGSRIITLTGDFNKETFLTELCNNIMSSLPQAAKDVLGNNTIVIRSMSRLG